MKTNKDELYRLKILNLLRDLIHEDWGDEPEKFEEEQLNSQAWKAYNVLKSVYEQDN